MTKRKFPVGELVWFTKSMRMCKVKEWLSDGMYRVEVLDSQKQLIATEDGLDFVHTEFQTNQDNHDI